MANMMNSVSVVMFDKNTNQVQSIMRRGISGKI